MHKVKCYYCNEYFDRDADPCEKVTGNRYAHRECYSKNFNRDSSYIDLIYHYLSKEVFISLDLSKTWFPVLKKQLDKYIEENKYTYEGIYYALKYHYDVKKGDPQKSGGRIGIVPFVYDEAQNHFVREAQAGQRILTQFEQFQSQNKTQQTIYVPQAKEKTPSLIDMNSILDSED